MYCPNCGKDNSADQVYCRACGLKLDEIALVVAGALPSEENVVLRRRKRLLENLGKGALSIAGLIALMSFLLAAALYKLIVFGPELLFVATAIALAVFALLGAGLIGYSKLFLAGAAAGDRADRTEEKSLAHTTGKLIEDSPFEGVPSVVESTTDLLPRKSGSDRN